MKVKSKAVGKVDAAITRLDVLSSSVARSTVRDMNDGCMLPIILGGEVGQGIPSKPSELAKVTTRSRLGTVTSSHDTSACGKAQIVSLSLSV